MNNYQTTTTPKCPYFTECGGCQTQHIPYEVQLKNKQQRLAQLFQVPIEQIKVFSANPYNYRNRMDFIFHNDGLGFREKGNWRKILDIEQCPISDQTINTLLTEIREQFSDIDAFKLRSHKGMFRFAVIRSPKGGSAITFILNEDATGRFQVMEQLEKYAKNSTAQNILVGFVPAETESSTAFEVVELKGSQWLTEEIDGRKFRFHSQGFFQNNTQMAQKMVTHVQELLKDASGELLDLYGGVGLFGISCAKPFEKVHIVESVDPAIEAALYNLKQNSVKGDAHVLDAKKINKLKIRPKHVITDPPRSGMDRLAIKHLIAMNPKTITYISCNPEQLSKELFSFKQAGYNIESAAMFDLFPQTNHMEAIVHLKRKS